MTIECAYEIVSLLLEENKNENVKKALETIKESAQIVRCKDCKYYGDENGFLKDDNGKLFGGCTVHNFLIEEDYFCSGGRRMVNGEGGDR